MPTDSPSGAHTALPGWVEISRVGSSRVTALKTLLLIREVGRIILGISIIQLGYGLKGEGFGVDWAIQLSHNTLRAYHVR